MAHLYRVVRHVNPACPRGERVSYQVHEVYYRSTGGIERVSTSPVAPTGPTRDQLKKHIFEFQKALDRAVIDYVTLKEIPWPKTAELDTQANAT